MGKMELKMGVCVEELVGHMAAGTGFDLSWAEIREKQVVALNERFQDMLGRIKLLRQRAEDAGVTEISRLDDAVPLLLPHTAYKSYPESFLTERRWDRLTRWLGTVSAHPITEIDLSGIEDIDQWIEACGKAGIFVSCTSGTTGKPAMLPSTRADLDFAAAENVQAVQWGSDVRAGDKRTIASFGATARSPRNDVTGAALVQAFADFSKLGTAPSKAPQITIGSITKMITLRKAIADGTARPNEIEEFSRESAAREASLAGGLGAAADHIIAHRADKLLILAMWGPLFQLAQEVRNRGFTGKDFHPENGVFLGGGLKGAQVPADYKEFIYETFNLTPAFTYQMYGMQETQTSMPRCSHGRYHIPAWMVCLPLNKDGDQLLPIEEAEIEGRAAFFDLSIEGRWGGIISGDKISVDFRPCACGSPSPSIADSIARYADIEGDDKIACSGTVDAYVRGI